MAPRFEGFKAAASGEVANRGWFRSIGLVPLVVGMIVFAAIGALLAFIAIDGWRTVYPRWSDVVLLGLAVAAFVNAAVLLGASTRRKLWRRRTKAAALEAERWDAFRRYLQDFPRLQEAPPATLELWERLLVYGIAFGIADRVLQAAHMAMPEALAQASSVYWISGYGDLGGGASAMSIGDLASGFGSALAPPSSGSGGGGGGFSAAAEAAGAAEAAAAGSVESAGSSAVTRGEERERYDRHPRHHLELPREERVLDLGAGQGQQFLLLEVVRGRAPRRAARPGPGRGGRPEAAVAVDDVRARAASSRRPRAPSPPGAPAAPRPAGSSPGVEVAADRRERVPSTAYLVCRKKRNPLVPSGRRR